jgi:hypothetical protein
MSTRYDKRYCMVDNRCPMVIDFRAKLPVFLIASVGSPLAVFLSGRQPIEPSILSPLVVRFPPDGRIHHVTQYPFGVLRFLEQLIHFELGCRDKRSCWELSCLVVLTTPFFWSDASAFCVSILLMYNSPSDHFITSCSACSWKPELDETGFSANVPIAF